MQTDIGCRHVRHHHHRHPSSSSSATAPSLFSQIEIYWNVIDKNMFIPKLSLPINEAKKNEKEERKNQQMKINPNWNLLMLNGRLRFTLVHNLPISSSAAEFSKFNAMKKWNWLWITTETKVREKKTGIYPILSMDYRISKHLKKRTIKFPSR